VCSGIEAASVAWHHLGWEAAWLAEVDVQAANVLSWRLGATAPQFPLPGSEKTIAKMQWGDRVTNWGDMTRLPEMLRSGVAEAPDIFCGGTPCQDFSVAGLRAGLEGDRGNLTLTFVEIANEIDFKRAENGDEPCIIFWENVPGVLSDKTNAFGCFLAGLAGEDVPLEPSGKRWSDAGVVIGPQRTVAWRKLDAQYVDLAQRRERVFVVASSREGFDPVEILLEFDGVRRDSAPRREAWEETAGTLDARTTGGGFPGTDGACSGHDVPADRTSVLNGMEVPGLRGRKLGIEPEAVGLQEMRVVRPRPECSGRPGRASGLTPAIAIQERAIADTNCGPGGKDWREDDCAYTMEARHRPQYVAYEASPQWWDGSPVSQTLDAVLHKGQTMPEKNRFPAVLQPIPFDTTQITNPTNGSNPKPGAPCHTLASGAAAPAIAFSCKDYGADATEELSPTMRAMGHKDSHPNAGGQIAVCVTGDRTHALNTANNGKGCSEDGTGRGVPTVAVALRGREGGNMIEIGDEVSNTLRASGGGSDKAHVFTDMAVRRLMPVECERLQGFPDGWTAVPTTPVSKANQTAARAALEAGDPSFVEVGGVMMNVAADGPRYKQLGNSWPVTVVAWIGERIDRKIRSLDSVTIEIDADAATVAWLTAA